MDNELRIIVADGFTISETLKNGETYMIDGKLYMNQHTYTQLKTSIEFENLLKR